MSGRRPVYTKNLAHFLGAFVDAVGDVPVADVTTEQVEAWVGAARAPWSKASRLNRVSTLFAFAVRRGWVSANVCDRVERITIDRHPPRILLADECRRLLQAATARLRPWLVLGLFVGLRPTEAERMDWSSIRLRDRVAIVDGATSKVRRRRIVPLHPAAVAWLALDAREAGPVVSSHSTLRRDRRSAAMAAGIRWSADILRHTYGSMRMADGGLAAAVAGEMGNSTGILLTHYRELVRRDEAVAFWRCTPERREAA